MFRHWWTTITTIPALAVTLARHGITTEVIECKQYFGTSFVTATVITLYGSLLWLWCYPHRSTERFLQLYWRWWLTWTNQTVSGVSRHGATISRRAKVRCWCDASMPNVLLLFAKIKHGSKKFMVVLTVRGSVMMSRKGVHQDVSCTIAWFDLRQSK